MREIKFRAWGSNSMVSWKELSERWFKDSFGELMAGKCKSKDGEDYILMQFTGLLDHNGKEIYEGDVVSYKDPYDKYAGNYLVKWIDEMACWGLNTNAVSYSTILRLSKVLGNQYQNPELLKNDK